MDDRNPSANSGAGPDPQTPPVNPYAPADAPNSPESVALSAPSSSGSSATPTTSVPSASGQNPSAANPNPNPAKPAQKPSPAPRRAGSTSDPRGTMLWLVVGVALVIFALVSYGLQMFFLKNPYGPELKIDNFSDNFRSVPADPRDKVFAAVYAMVKSNSADDAVIPEKGALVRKDSPLFTPNTEMAIYYGTFIVDIPDIRQSYRVQFEYSNEKDNANLSGYGVLLTCLTGGDIIYPEFKCTDMLTHEDEQATTDKSDFPIMTKLPIDIDYYDRKTGIYTSYRISGDLSVKEGKRSFKIVIIDRSGGNREKALERIRNLDCGPAKCNPSDYAIEYRDQSSSEGHAG